MSQGTSDPTDVELREAERLYNKQRIENAHGYMMGYWKDVSIPVRNTWIALVRKRDARTK